MPFSETIQAAVLDSLAEEGLPLEDIAITVEGAGVALRGTVLWRYQGDRIEYLVDRVDGVRVLATRSR